MYAFCFWVAGSLPVVHSEGLVMAALEVILCFEGAGSEQEALERERKATHRFGILLCVGIGFR
jgi:hypothetical protein